jgi:hypothetical protein
MTRGTCLLKRVYPYLKYASSHQEETKTEHKEAPVATGAFLCD